MNINNLEIAVFQDLYRTDPIVSAIIKAGSRQRKSKHQMLLEMVVALAEVKTQLSQHILDLNTMSAKPMVIHCTPEQAADLMKSIEPGEIIKAGGL